MDVSKFTPAFKDVVLAEIISRTTPYRYSYFEWKLVCEDSQLLDAILNQFKEREFLSEFNLRHSTPTCGIIVTARALDFMNAGGFTAEHEFFDIKMSKAILELDKLQSNPGLKDYVKQIAGITGIISDAVSTFRTFFGSSI